MMLHRAGQTKRSRTTSPQIICLSGFGGAFNILWIVVRTPHDDQIFHAAADKQLGVVEKAQVASAQVTICHCCSGHWSEVSSVASYVGVKLM